MIEVLGLTAITAYAIWYLRVPKVKGYNFSYSIRTTGNSPCKLHTVKGARNPFVHSNRQFSADTQQDAAAQLGQWIKYNFDLEALRDFPPRPRIVQKMDSTPQTQDSGKNEVTR